MKNPDIFRVYSTSRQYVGKYAGNIPAIVPNSLDSRYSQSNIRYTSHISKIYQSPYTREESYMFEYSDNVSGSGPTRYREYTGFFYMLRIYRLVSWLIWPFSCYDLFEYIANMSASFEYTANIRQIYRR